MKMILVYSTFGDTTEADKVSNILLDKRLVACAKKLTVDSKFWWEGKIDNSSEVLVMYETIEEKYDEIEKTITENHSYETPMIVAIPVFKTTMSVQKWLEEEIKL